MECGICCGIVRRQIQCVYCGYHACSSCVETYLLGSTNDPSCMNCRSTWDILFLRKELHDEFLNGAYKEHRKDLLSKRFQRRINSSILCPCPSCPYGNVDRTTKTCQTCWTIVCDACRDVGGNNHSCRQDVLSSRQEISRLTKECPGCHAPIEKLSGCFQMFCTQCYTPFDWKDGRILEKKTLHNPHYFEHQSSASIQHVLENMNQPLYKEFCFLLMDIKKQIHIYQPTHENNDMMNDCRHLSHEQLFHDDQSRLQQHCQHALWFHFYKQGMNILRDLASGKQVKKQIHQFQTALKEKLLEYNEYVAECVQLRGLRLFPFRSLIVC